MTPPETTVLHRGLQRAWRVVDHRYFVPSVVAFGVLARLLFALLPVEPVSDFAWYHHRASELAAGQGYNRDDGVPTAYWPVGWPAFLAILYLVAGPAAWVARLVQVALGAVTLWTTWRIAAHLTGSERAARLALLLLACYPNHAVFGASLASENLLLPLCGVTALGLLGGGPLARQSLWRWATIGLGLGLIALVKPQGVLLLLPLLLRPVGPWRPRLARLAVISAVGMATLTPWAVRNARVLGAPVLVSTNGGVNLLIGNSDRANGGYVEPPELRALMATQTEVQRDRTTRDLALTWMSAHPMRALVLVPAKWQALLATDDDMVFAIGRGWPSCPPGFRWLGRLNRVYWLLFLATSCIGVVAAVRQKRDLSGVYVLALVLLNYSVFFGSPRFHAPMVPWMAVYAGQWLTLRLGALRQA